MKLRLNILSLLTVTLAITASTAAHAADKLPATAVDPEVLALVKASTAETAPTNTADAKNAANTIAIPDEQLPVFKAPAVKTEKADKKSGVWMWVRLVGSLAIVLALFGGGIYGFKRISLTGKLGKFAKPAKMIHVLGQHHMGTKKSLAVVRVAGETVLIGITDSNISLLKTLSLLDEDLPGESIAQKSKFTNALKQNIKREEQTHSRGAEPVEEFSMEGIRDIVSKRIKDLRDTKS